MSSAPYRQRSEEKSAQTLIEEAVHLLRQTPLAWLALYYFGSGLWVWSLLSFWAHTTWFAPTEASLAWSSLGLAAAYVASKTAHALFCGALLDRLLSRPHPPFTVKRMLKIASAQLRIQSWGLLLVPLAMVATVPFGWVFAFYQNVSVFGAETGDDRCVAKSLAQAKLWPRQNHMGLLLLSFLTLAVFANLIGAYFVIPWMGRHLLGFDNFLGLRGVSLVNSTFMVSLIALTWLAVDPLVKAFYVLRVYYGQALQSGEDLRSELSATLLRSSRAFAALLAFAFSFVSVKKVFAENPPPAESASVNPADLDRSIDQVLQGHDFQWRLRPLPGAQGEPKDNAITRFLKEGIDMLKSAFNSVGNAFQEFLDWLNRRSGKSPPSHPGGGLHLPGASLLLYLFLAVVVVLLLVAIVQLWRKGHRSPKENVTLAQTTAPAPDLRDRTVSAAQLPTDGWLKLAHDQIAAGEWRLALRALYLATLARLGEEGLVTLARFKTDTDYENELGRRAIGRRELVTQFSARRLLFQRSWYGQFPAAESDVRAWLSEMKP